MDENQIYSVHWMMQLYIFIDIMANRIILQIIKQETDYKVVLLTHCVHMLPGLAGTVEYSDMELH